VVVYEPIPGDWKMKNESHPHEKVAAGTAQWKVKVAAEGKFYCPAKCWCVINNYCGAAFTDLSI